jgi:hypothetical protein
VPVPGVSGRSMTVEIIENWTICAETICGFCKRQFAVQRSFDKLRIVQSTGPPPPKAEAPHRFVIHWEGKLIRLEVAHGPVASI